MSTAYAIAAVSYVLQDTLTQGLIDHAVDTALGVNVAVNVKSPDQVDANTQINIFLYQVTPNLGWRNECLPSRNARSERLTNQPLAIDLHYLISVHGSSDLFSEILLGSAMQTLHEKPFFDREAVRDLLPTPDADPLLNALGNAGIADQLEQITLTPEYLSNEDMSKLWSALQSNYRSSATYVATVVLIKAEKPSVSALPVLTRGITTRPNLLPPTPTLMSVEYTNQQIAAHLSNPLPDPPETVTINGYNLLGTDGEFHTAGEVIAAGLTINARLQMLSAEQVLDIPLLTSSTHEQVVFALPNDPTLLRAGMYSLSLVMNNLAGDNPTESNQLPLTIAPRFSGFTASRDIVDNTLSVDIVINPEVHAEQKISFIIGQNEKFSDDIVLGPGVLTTEDMHFEFPNIPSGNYWARVRVDGIDSLLIDRSKTPPEFVATQQVTVPA